MNLSTPKPCKTASRSMNETLQLPERQPDRGAVINNDWVPATQSSAMHHAEPVKLAGPLRPMWYLKTAKKALFKIVPRRQTV